MFELWITIIRSFTWRSPLQFSIASETELPSSEYTQESDEGTLSQSLSYYSSNENIQFLPKSSEIKIENGSTEKIPVEEERRPTMSKPSKASNCAFIIAIVICSVLVLSFIAFAIYYSIGFSFLNLDSKNITAALDSNSQIITTTNRDKSYSYVTTSMPTTIESKTNNFTSTNTIFDSHKLLIEYDDSEEESSGNDTFSNFMNKFFEGSGSSRN